MVDQGVSATALEEVDLPPGSSDLHGRVAVVTGASAGIGRACALALAAADSRLAELRLQAEPASGNSECTQGALRLRCEVRVQAMAQARLWRVQVEVRASGESGPPLARLLTVLERRR